MWTKETNKLAGAYKLESILKIWPYEIINMICKNKCDDLASVCVE